MKNTITLTIMFLFTGFLLSQNIELTCGNPTITNDGVDDWYETDIMIAAIEGQPDFKLGSGLLYINYNVDAFGSNINASGSVVIEQSNPDYILGDINALPYYTDFIIADNTPSRIAYSFQQGLSAGGMVENVTSTPKKLFRLRIKFVNSMIDPMVEFEDNETQPPGVNDCRDQFYTACGPETFTFPDCTNEPGTQFIDAIFNCAGGTLSNNRDLALETIRVYPNPTTDLLNIEGDLSDMQEIRLLSINGQIVGQFKTESPVIDLSGLQSGMYFLQLVSTKELKTIKVIKN